MGVTSVAVIGLGRMGLPIAHNLLERGFTVSGYHRTPGSELAGTGASLARSAADGAAHGDVLLSIVPDADAVDEVVTGRTGTLTAGGSPGMVAPRLATTFASGDRRSVDAVSGVLDAISGPWVYTGEFGTGSSMKYVATAVAAVDAGAGADRDPASHPRPDCGPAGAVGLDAPVFSAANALRCSTRPWPAAGPSATSPPCTMCWPPPTRAWSRPDEVFPGHLPRRRRGRDRRPAGRHELVAPPELKRWASMLELLEDWPGAAAILAGLELRDALRLQAATLLAPVIWPRKVLCAGVNYRKHIKEMGGEVPAMAGARTSSSSRRRRPLSARPIRS